MKRSFQHIVHNKDGTFSGIQSVSCFQRICIFVDSCFTIGGYYEAEEDELIELLFVYYKMNDGVVFRRLFERCSFSFVGFTRAQIDDVMQKLEGKRRPSHLWYSFFQCTVWSDGVELENYPLYTTNLRETMPEPIRKAAIKSGRENEYNLREMTIDAKCEKIQFNEAYHRLMKYKRALRHKIKPSSCGACTNVKKRRLYLTTNQQTT